MSSTKEEEGTTKTEEICKGESELTTLRRQVEAFKQLAHRLLNKQENLKLEDLPVEWQDDRDLVLAAVCGKAVTWNNLSNKWKGDAGLAVATMDAQEKTYTGKGFDRRLPGYQCVDEASISNWRDLPYKLQTSLEVILTALQAKNGPQFEEIPFWHRQNPEVVFTALKYRKLRFEDISIDLQQNHREISFYGITRGLIRMEDCSCRFETAFLKEAIENGEIEWPQLPSHLRDDIAFARSIEKFVGEINHNPRMILEHFAAHRHDPSFWRHLFRALSYVSTHFLTEFAPPGIFSDRDFMLELCGQNIDVFHLVELTLRSSHSFLEVALGQNPEILRYLPHDTQLDNPGLIVSTLPSLGRLSKDDRYSMVSYEVAFAMAPVFWEDRDFVLSWAKAGLCVPTQNVPRDVFMNWREDEELFLLFAEHNSKQLYLASSSLRGNKDFMLKVIQYHPSFYSEALDGLQFDFDVAVYAFSGSAALAKEYMWKFHFDGKDEKIESILDLLRKRIGQFDTFSSCILGSMLSTKSVESTGTPLSLLNQGAETSVVYKKLLAEYLGIPLGKWLDRLRKAERNICQAIAPWAPNA